MSFALPVVFLKERCPGLGCITEWVYLVENVCGALAGPRGWCGPGTFPLPVTHISSLLHPCPWRPVL